MPPKKSKRQTTSRKKAVQTRESEKYSVSPATLFSGSENEPGVTADAEQIEEEIAEALAEYGSHSSYHAEVAPAADKRLIEIQSALRSAFKDFITIEELEVIDFSVQTVDDLAKAIISYPTILKSLLLVCNIASRAIIRDLNMKSFNTYARKISRDKANQVAGFIKSFLPPSIPLLALLHADRNAYIDKEMRASKGRWEQVVTEALCLKSGLTFRKTMFDWQDDEFELDSAFFEKDPSTGKRLIRLAVDVKRIEASADVHKRADEIVNKAKKLKEVFPDSKFGAILYYPLVNMQSNLRDRMRSPDIDALQFANQTATSIELAAALLLGTFGVEVLDKELPEGDE